MSSYGLEGGESESRLSSKGGRDTALHLEIYLPRIDEEGALVPPKYGHPVMVTSYDAPEKYEDLFPAEPGSSGDEMAKTPEEGGVGVPEGQFHGEDDKENAREGGGGKSDDDKRVNILFELIRNAERKRSKKPPSAQSSLTDATRSQSSGGSEPRVLQTASDYLPGGGTAEGRREPPSSIHPGKKRPAGSKATKKSETTAVGESSSGPRLKSSARSQPFKNLPRKATTAYDSNLVLNPTYRGNPAGQRGLRFLTNLMKGLDEYDVVKVNCVRYNSLEDNPKKSSRRQVCRSPKGKGLAVNAQRLNLRQPRDKSNRKVSAPVKVSEKIPVSKPKEEPAAEIKKTKSSASLPCSRCTSKETVMSIPKSDVRVKENSQRTSKQNSNKRLLRILLSHAV